MNLRFENIFYPFFILFVCFFAFFINNQIIPADPMEARNLATAQEMVSQGNYLTPTMNGQLRLEKPPLPTWIAAGIENIVPDNLILQRCIPGLAATLMVFLLYLLVVKLTKEKKLGFITSLILATSFNIILIGRTASWDIYCHSFMLVAIYFLICAFEDRGAQWGKFFLAGIFMGLSFLGKGPVSFFALLLPFIIAYIFIYKPFFRGKKLPLLLMIITCLAISFWWPIYIAISHHEFAAAILQKESTAWFEHNVRPFYYYWKFPAESGIWTLFWTTSIIYFFIKRPQENGKIYAFSIIWTLSILILLSIVPEKKTRYLLPVLIPGAINVGVYLFNSLKSLTTSKGERIIFRINTILIAIILLAIPIVLYIMFFQKDLISFPVYTIISGISICIVIYIFFALFGKNAINVMGVLGAIVATMIMIEGLCLPLIGNVFINNERHSIHLIRNSEELKNLPFYYNKDESLRTEFVYEVDRIVRPIDIQNDGLIYSNLPFVFISHAPIDSIMQGKNVDIKFIDTFDNNWVHKTDKRHNKELVRNVAIIKEKAKSAEN